MARTVLVQMTVDDDVREDNVLDYIDTGAGEIHDVRVVTAPHVVMAGSPVGGFAFIGPFESAEDAVEYGEQSGDRRVDEEWWAIGLAAPVTPEPVKVAGSAPKHAPEWGDDD